MVEDPRTGERFLRVVGRRSSPALGVPPSPAARRALASLATYRTAAPKGVFVYSNHADMAADRVRWTVARMVRDANDR